MRKPMTPVLLLAAGLLLPFSGLVRAENTPVDILCATVDVVECRPGRDCDEVSASAIDAPLFLRLNLAEKKVQTIREADQRLTTDIKTLVRSDGLIFLQGVDAARKGGLSAVGWTMSLDEINGHMVVTASGRDVGYTLFGTCTTIERQGMPK